MVLGAWLGSQIQAGAGTPQIQWQRTFGGANQEVVSALRPMAEGGFVVGGFSDSGATGNKSSPGHGRFDYWVVRLDSSGEKLWERADGGTSDDCLTALETLRDGGLILAGFSLSTNSGNKSSPGFGNGDYWIVRLDGEGGKVWDKTYGTTNHEVLTSVQPVGDGGFILAGYVVLSRGADWWIVRVGADGNQLWERTFGGDRWEESVFIRLMSDGGFVLGGHSDSPPSGNKTSSNYGLPYQDFWLIRLDESGKMLWEKSFGGGSADWLFSIETTSDGGFLLGGMSRSSPGGNKSSPFLGGPSFGDFWVVKADHAGSKMWDKSFGGSGEEIWGGLALMADDGLAIVGSSTSGIDGTKTSPSQGEDMWIVRLDVHGNQVWDKTLGGSGSERAYDVLQDQDCGLVVAGIASGPADGNRTAPSFGDSDFWVVKLAPDDLSLAPRLTVPAQSSAEITTFGFEMILTGVSNHWYQVEYSTNLISWNLLNATQAAGIPLKIRDSVTTHLPRRFYRARLRNP